MRRFLGALLVAGAVSLAAAGVVTAHGPTCSDVGFLGVETHGQHIVRDYVTGGDASAWPPSGGAVGAGNDGPLAAGAAGRGHREADIAPGASFCNPQSSSPGFHVPS